jgi:hypothetical protein
MSVAESEPEFDWGRASNVLVGFATMSWLATRDRVAKIVAFQAEGYTMKKSSRSMPRYVAPQVGLFRTLFGLVLLVLLFVYLVFFAALVPFVFLTFIASAFVISVYKNRADRARLEKIAMLRSDQDIGTFAKSFDFRSVDTWVIRAVYEQLQNYLASFVPKFPISAEDRLKEDLCIDVDDFDLGEEIEQRCGRLLEGSQTNPLYGKVYTVRDLVLYFNSQPSVATRDENSMTGSL